MVTSTAMGTTPGLPADAGVSASEGLTEEMLRSLAGAILEAAQNAQLGVSVTLVDEQPMRRIYVNDAAARIFGYSQDELLKLPSLFTFTPEEQARIEELDAKRRRGETIPFCFETEIVRKDGSRAPVEVAYSRVLLDDRMATIAFLRDIRQRKNGEEALRRSESMFRKLIEAAPEAVVVMRDNRLVYVNPSFLRLLGYEALEDIAVPALDLIHPDDRRALAAKRPRHPSLELRPPPDEFRMFKQGGELIHVESSWLYIDFEGQPASLSFIRDVTGRRRAQEQLIQTDRMATIGTLAAGVAHELNNPLAYVLLNLGLLDKELTELLSHVELHRVKSRLVTLQQGAERMATIVRDLRSLCRPDAPALHPVDVRAVLESAINMSLNELNGRARVVRDYADAPHVNADGARLGQVFLNLLLNAAHAIPEGHPEKHEIRVSLFPGDGNRVYVEVTDTGQGIPRALLGRIFEPFFTTKPAGIGMGLGLSISQSIIASMHGELTVESEEGNGSTFRVAIPLGTRPSKVTPPPAPPATPPPPTPRGVRVLIIDDEPALAAALGSLLSLDHQVTVVGRGDHALARLSSGELFDVILCDVLMPGVSGMDIYQELERSHPAMLSRIIFMTGASTMQRVSDFFAKVESPRLEKPIDVERLKRTIDAIAPRRPA